VDVVYLDNRGRSVGSAIEEAIEGASRASVAVAYSTESGIGRLRPGIEDLSSRGGSARLLTGLDDFLTDVGAVDAVARLPGAECRVFLPRGVGGAGRFHPKLYVFEGERESSVIVGSANLTGAGLETNHEASLWLRGEPDDDTVGAIRDGFDLLWASPRAVALTEQVREDYQQAKRARDRAMAEIVKLDDYRKWNAALRANVARALVRPGSRRWLMITSSSNFEICLRLGRWGDERLGRIAQVQPGDGLVFYITGQSALGALAVAVGPARFSHERPWPDRPYPYQMDIQFLTVAEPRPSIRPLIAELDAFARAPANWGRYLQTTLLELSQRDFGVLAQALGAARVSFAAESGP
jgi:HKD family nuclease